MTPAEDEPSESGAVSLRAARLEDAEVIAGLGVASWRATYRGVLPDELLDSLSVAEQAARRRTMIATPPNPEARNWVLEDTSGVFGWASAGLARDEVPIDHVHELFAIYLDPSRVGQGLGRRLLNHCIRDAVGRGYREMILWVLVGNERADRFYAAAGFRRDDRVDPKPYRETTARQIRLRLKLR